MESTSNTTNTTTPSINFVYTGVRGVSNLTSWMTKSQTNTSKDSKKLTETEMSSNQGNDDNKDGMRKHKFVPSDANRDINVRKQRLDIGDGMSLAEIRAVNGAADKIANTKEEILSTIFPSCKQEIEQSIRSFVTTQIVEYLGEEEATMIDFVMKHLQKVNTQERSVAM